MREILFRAWDKVSKKYREFDGMHDTITINKDGKVEYYNLQNGSGGDDILEQFTGLHDKNGKMIFEGDIFTSDYFKDGLEFEVVFSDGAFCGESNRTGLFPLGFTNDYYETGDESDDFYYAEDYTSHIQIIGNIHDNPELLT